MWHIDSIYCLPWCHTEAGDDWISRHLELAQGLLHSGRGKKRSSSNNGECTTEKAFTNNATFENVVCSADQNSAMCIPFPPFVTGARV
jgi:hypothetical protein